MPGGGLWWLPVTRKSASQRAMVVTCTRNNSGQSAVVAACNQEECQMMGCGDYLYQEEFWAEGYGGHL